ncbi:hypothetical protein [uncultured Litoreibacter sp.]|uniref:hypothetical protein n=1 Tax=uncultured Litoreibacter sp. TaxID=1392394 RepID=UPI00260E4F08|nr:hypothetical protein [uncultured Litoreibacter sp.]
MKHLIPFAVAAALALCGTASAKTVTYVETVTRADGSMIVTRTTVVLPAKVTITRATLTRSALRTGLR